MPQSETDPRGSERAFERGSYDSVATFAKQWNAGQTEWVKSASKRTEMAQVERARFEDNSGAIVSEERVSLQDPLSKKNPRLSGDSLQICRPRQQTLDVLKARVSSALRMRKTPHKRPIHRLVHLRKFLGQKLRYVLME